MAKRKARRSRRRNRSTALAAPSIQIERARRRPLRLPGERAGRSSFVRYAYLAAAVLGGYYAWKKFKK